jgi:hypothetical protein
VASGGVDGRTAYCSGGRRQTEPGVKGLAHLIAAATEGVGGVEEAVVHRDVVLLRLLRTRTTSTMTAERDAVDPQ